MSNKPYELEIRNMIETAIDNTYRIVSTSEGIPFGNETPNQDIEELLDDCFACEVTELAFFADGEFVGQVCLVPFDAANADEVIQDYHCNKHMQEIVAWCKLPKV